MEAVSLSNPILHIDLTPRACGQSGHAWKLNVMDICCFVRARRVDDRAYIGRA